MKILVTGGSGFIGSNFILNQMHSTNNSILNYDKLTYAGNPYNLSKIENDSKYTFIKGCITDHILVGKVINEFKPDSIIHFAAESHVDRSIDAPMDFIKTNILGTAVLLNTSYTFWSNKKLHNNFRFLHISTDEVFGSLQNNGFFNESSNYNPSSPYSASKASSDHLVKAWHKTYNFPTIIVNCSNNYGPYQFPEKLIPLIISNCLDEKTLPIYGDGLNVRDWLYVDDHCEAIYSVLKYGNTGDSYTIGGNNEISNIDIVKSICNILDKIKPRKNLQSYIGLITYVEDRPGHDFRYAIDSSKIRNELKWNPKENFQTGLQKTVKWYLENEDWWRNIQKGAYSQKRLGLKNV